MGRLLPDSGRGARRRRWGRRAVLLPGGLAFGAVALVLAHDRIQPVLRDPGAPPSVVYALCESNLASFQILPPRRSGEPFAIAAQLDRSATQEIEGLTERNVGRSLEIVIGEWVFLRGPIRSSLRSGLLVNAAFATRDEAETWLRKLRNDLPERPCGHESRVSGSAASGSSEQAGF